MALGTDHLFDPYRLPPTVSAKLRDQTKDMLLPNT